MVVISVSLPAKDLEAFDAVACYQNSMLPAGSRSIRKQTRRAHQEICQWKVSPVRLSHRLGAGSQGALGLEVDRPSEDRDQSAAEVAALGGDRVLDSGRHPGEECAFNKT